MNRFFNLQHALFGAATMAVYAACANISSGLRAAGAAALAQGVLSFLIVGANTALFLRVYERFGAFAAIATSTSVTVSLAAVVHALANTANYTTTLVVVFAAAAINFSVLAFARKRYGSIRLTVLAKMLLKGEAA